MRFIAYDLIFLVLFTLFVIIFLYQRRNNLKKEGLLYLYRTKLGLKFIEWFTKKYNTLLKNLQYVVIISGFVLMFGGIWLILRLVYYYITSPYIARVLKVPVIMPLIPYLPEIFKIDFLPPFYFTYWIIIIAIIAIPHEFAHGIFARLNKIRILSTGFGFLGPFLAAFVEQDDKQMQKAKKFSQLLVLAAGTFANLVVALLFSIIFVVFFLSAFSPAGINFNMYAGEAINPLSISAVNYTFFSNSSLALIKSANKTYFADKETLDIALKSNDSILFAFDDSPALRAKLRGAISEINDKKITNYNDLNSTLASYNPGENIIIKTIYNGEVEEYNITLSERNEKSFLGIGIASQARAGFFGLFYNLLAKIKDPIVYYESKVGNLGVFIIDLLWWIIVISISVALMNMLPLGIFDGGRFFYLTIWGLTGSEKVGKFAFKMSTWILLGIVALMLVKWLAVFLF